jgi:F-type H+-transporting ATPase subunit gamma
MEMVSAAKMKKMQQRLFKSKPYEEKVNHIMGDIISHGGAALDDPLLVESANPKKVLILHVTGNRGLCGSYNSNSIERTVEFREKLEGEGKECQLYVIGKKGINFYNFTGTPMYKTAMNMEDKFNLEEAAKIGSEMTSLFLDGEFDEVYVSYTKVMSASSQKPNIFKLLPISIEKEKKEESMKEASADYQFEPDMKRIFSYLLPLYLKVKIFTCFLESSFSEQFLRRVAMKNATDASGEMIRELTITYNRVRQAKITNEIAEIVGGAAALE